MGKPSNYSNAGSSWDPEMDELDELKPEVLDVIFPSDAVYSQIGDNSASSSGSHVRSFLTGMGFSPFLVDKVIQENGEDNVDLLLEILVENSDAQKARNQSSDSLDSLLGDNEEEGPSALPPMLQPKEEPDIFNEVVDERRQTLLKMNFSATEVDFAIDKLGDNASIDELVDFISAVQVAEHADEGTNGMPQNLFPEKKVDNDENLYGTMEKTLQLLGMGFTENDVSLAIERIGSEVPVLELANCICAAQAGEVYVPQSQQSSRGRGTNSTEFFTQTDYGPGDPLTDTLKMETEHLSQEESSQSRNKKREAARKGKRPRHEPPSELSHLQFTPGTSTVDEYEAKLKPEFIDDFLSAYLVPEWTEEERVIDLTPSSYQTASRKPLSQVLSKPPYFFYGNVANLPMSSWAKMSEFLDGAEPEFVNTQLFSALTRREGYLHNLPTENRFHILPKPPMSIQDSIPQSKQWWPAWDTRRQLNSVNCDVVGVPQLCDRLGQMLRECRGKPTAEQKQELLHYCQRLNLVWVGPNRVAPIEPDYLEIMLGYPLNHTEDSGVSLADRLQSLKYSFQIDALGYHLSSLKSLLPQGITMLSLSTGIGGAEVALHRLGVQLKNLVSVESSEEKRKMLRRWWSNSAQTGELVQINDIQRLTSNKLEELVRKYGCFDFVICQDPFVQHRKPKMAAAASNAPPMFDFSGFFEFVRVVQRVRSLTEEHSRR
ncbi:unnamed protein product [Linum trigynum]|uniref:SAM-dependent MTase DRM-type domain-containing protein n=1 Tax=Linum trigynum TaxID=586398 RepID=A0AAV2GSW9_9ROSI